MSWVRVFWMWSRWISDCGWFFGGGSVVDVTVGRRLGIGFLGFW